jgi:hypothetical protein
MIRKFAFALLMAGLLTACGESKDYPIAAKDVTAKLLSTKPPMFVFGGTATDLMVTQGEGGAVRWTVLKGGTQVMRLVATVTANGDNASRVAVAIEPPNNDTSSQIAKNMAENPAIVKLYKAAMVEQIDAKLNNRAFDSTAIQGQMMAAAMASMPKIANSMDEAAKRSRDMESQMRQSERDAAYARNQRAAENGYSNDNGGGSSDY